MKHLSIVFAASAIILAPVAASAAGQDASTAAPAAVVKPAKVESRKERLVCKTMEEKGSRLGGKRVCRSQAEWDEMAAQQRQELERRLSIGPARQ